MNRDGNGKSRNGHGKVMDKYVVKPVGTVWGSKRETSVITLPPFLACDSLNGDKKDGL